MSKNPYKTLNDKAEDDDLPFAVDLGDEPAYFPQVPMQATPALMGAVPVPITEDGMNYKITTALGEATLKRGIDFGMIPKAKKPSLLKAGAEKIATQLGLLQHYKIEVAEEHFAEQPAYCFYRVRCDLDKIGPDGKVYTICTGYGSANTLEKRNGQNDVWNAANSTLKMATKRALVAAALSVSSASGLFYQDLEDMDFNDSGTSALKQTQNPEAPLTVQQMKHIYALAADMGLTATQAQEALKVAGWPSVKAIKQKDYKAACDVFAIREETNNG